MSIKVADLPQLVTGILVRKNEVILCDDCDGLGFVTTEKLDNYHKRTYITFRPSCEKCEGDGRLIKTSEYIKFIETTDTTKNIPYTSFKDTVDPHLYEERWFRLKLDNRDYTLENKHPDLAMLSYDHYDKLADQYRLIELLKKEKTNE